MDILGQHKNNYKDIFFEDETNTSQIYKAYNKNDERSCCLKVISKEQLKIGDYDLLLEQINREEKLTKLCKSENIVNLYQRLETNENIILELEYCDEVLRHYFDENGEFSENLEFFKLIVISLAKALKTIHEKGVMHRDIKPQNIFILEKRGKEEEEEEKEEEEKEKIIKLGDFGCSIFIKDNTSDPIGTIVYTAPEILKNLQYDEKCDLWSLGVTLYELYFGVLPYGPDATTNTIMDIIYDEDNFRLKKSNIPTLDILFNKLIVINPKNRINFNDFFDLVLDKNFMEKDYIPSKYKNFHEKILGKEDVKYDIKIIEEGLDPEKLEKENAEKILSFVKGGHLPDIMNFPNGGNTFNNIIYYDENVNQYSKSVNKDSDYFERMTPGAFILCTNMKSLKLIRAEILTQIKKDKRISFNLITTGSSCENVMAFLKEDKDFENCIKKVCVYCWKLKNWLYLKDKYNIIDIVCKKQADVINFINKYSSPDIKAYPLTKVITYQDYIGKYKERHFEIAKYYGDLSVESFKKNLENVKKIIEKEGDAKELKIKNNDKNKLFDAFLTFDIKKDIETLDKLIIKEYTKNTFYGDLNKWLMNSKMNSYETVAYFTSRLMYSLNNYGISNSMYYISNNSFVHRGIKLPYSCLLPYERAKGKVILLSGFTSTSLDENQAKNFSGRNQTKEQYKTRLIFSVIYIITNYYKEKWISNGVDIQKESVFKKEREILYQPFSFYYVRDVNIDLDNYTADIYLETIGKYEILEEKIKVGKTIKYNEKERIIEIN